MALPSATHKDTSCCSDKAVPVFPLGHNCSALTCSHKGSTVRRVRPPLKSTPAELWLNMWQVARGTCVLMCLHTCMFFSVFFSKNVVTVQRREEEEVGGLVKFWGLRCGVWASRGCLRPCVKSLWRCRGRCRHLETEQRWETWVVFKRTTTF